MRSRTVSLPAEEREPVDGAMLVRVDAQACEVRERLGTGRLVERAEEGVAAAVQPGGAGWGQAVADQGGEFEVGVASPEANFGDFGGGEKAVVGVAAG